MFQEILAENGTKFVIAAVVVLLGLLCLALVLWIIRGRPSSPLSSTCPPTATASVEDRPATSPASAPIAAISRTVVVLPFVPVTIASGTS